jgi:hypothetical protein
MAWRRLSGYDDFRCVVPHDTYLLNSSAIFAIGKNNFIG